MTKFLTWLKSLFIHPKEESNQMSEPLNDASTQVIGADGGVATAQPVAAAPVTGDGVQPKSPVASAIDNFLSSKGVNDFEAALAFVESGVAQLGAAAKDELKALAKKYL